MFRGIVAVVMSALLASCSLAEPRVGEIKAQIQRQFSPSDGRWSDTLSVFFRPDSPDGLGVLGRFHLIHDSDGTFFSVDAGQWTKIDRSGEVWLGINGLSFPTRRVPSGIWRLELVTKSGAAVEASFAIAAETSPFPRPPRLRRDPRNSRSYVVNGWPQSYLVWARDGQNKMLSRSKTVGSLFTVPEGTSSLTLYSYDPALGIGWIAGPFLVKDLEKNSDK